MILWPILNARIHSGDLMVTLDLWSVYSLSRWVHTLRPHLSLILNKSSNVSIDELLVTVVQKTSQERSAISWFPLRSSSLARRVQSTPDWRCWYGRSWGSREVQEPCFPLWNASLVRRVWSTPDWRCRYGRSGASRGARVLIPSSQFKPCEESSVNTQLKVLKWEVAGLVALIFMLSSCRIKMSFDKLDFFIDQ